MIVLDASALLAALLFEPGGDRVRDRSTAVIGAVNLAEVVERLQRDVEDSAVVAALATLDLTVIAADRDLAMTAGLLGRSTRALGLSLGDRFCLALGKRLGCPVLTADRVWLQIEPAIGVDVQVIR